MASTSLTERERFVLFWVLNDSPVSGGRAEVRKLDRLWSALKLDEVAALSLKRTQATAEMLDHDTRRDFELTSEQRDHLIAYCDTPALQGWAARLLYRLAGELMKARDGEGST